MHVFGPVAAVAALGLQGAPTRRVQVGDRAGEEFPVEIPSTLSVLMDFEGGGQAQSLYSTDSPLVRQGLVEITGTEGTVVIPDPNTFGGPITITRPLSRHFVPPEPVVQEVVDVAPEGVLAGRGLGLLDMARAIAEGRPHVATGGFGYHVLDTLLSIAEAAARRTFVEGASTLDHVRGGEHLAGDHDRRPQHRSAVTCLRLHDREVLGGERDRAAVDDLADPGEQVLAGAGDAAAEHDDRRVQQVHDRREHLADVAAGLTGGLDGCRIAGADEVDDVGGVVHVVAFGAQRDGEGRAAREGLEIPFVARLPPRAGAHRHLDVAHIARRSLGTALELTTGDDAGADAGRALHEHEVVHPRPARGLLAEREDVHIVVDEDRDVERTLHIAGYVEAVPARHDRRVGRAPRGVLDGAGDADAHAHEGEAAGGRGEQGAALCEDRVQQGLRSVADVDRARARIQDHAGQVGDGDGRVRGPEVDGQDEPGARVEGHPGGRAATGRHGLTGGAQEVGGQQSIDPGGDGRAGQSGEGGELRLGAGVPVAEDLEDLAGPGGGRGERSQQVNHGVSKAQHFLRSVVRLRIRYRQLLTKH